MNRQTNDITVHRRDDGFCTTKCACETVEVVAVAAALALRQPESSSIFSCFPCPSRSPTLNGDERATPQVADKVSFESASRETKHVHLVWEIPFWVWVMSRREEGKRMRGEGEMVLMFRSCPSI